MMTAYRFYELKADSTKVLPSEKDEFENLLLGEKRSQSAKRAVITKRAKYKTWPTRRNDHR